MTSWKVVVILLFVSACAGERPEAHRLQSRAPKPVKVPDAEAERALAGVKLSNPVLCDESCLDRDPALFTDLDAFREAECREGDASACAKTAPERVHPSQNAGRK